MPDISHPRPEDAQLKVQYPAQSGPFRVSRVNRTDLRPAARVRVTAAHASADGLKFVAAVLHDLTPDAARLLGGYLLVAAAESEDADAYGHGDPSLSEMRRVSDGHAAGAFTEDQS